jgi:hypothetical protein
MTKKISGGGVSITAEQAYWLLKHKSGTTVVCKEYGEDNCPECEESGKNECDCWTGMLYEDVAGMTLEEFKNSDWKTFEIW